MFQTLLFLILFLFLLLYCIFCSSSIRTRRIAARRASAACRVPAVAAGFPVRWLRRLVAAAGAVAAATGATGPVSGRAPAAVEIQPIRGTRREKVTPSFGTVCYS